MKICRFDDDRLGLVVEQTIVDVTEALQALPTPVWPVPHGDWLIRHFGAVRGYIEGIADDAQTHALAGRRLLSPVANPSKIIGAPVNYLKHQAESKADTGISFGAEVRTIDHYGLFLKANSSLVGPGEGVALRFTDRRNDHEAELAVIIGKTGTVISRGHALEHVAGYAMGLDMTVRGTEDRSLRKSIDTYAVLGPWLVTADEIDDPDDLDFTLAVNGDVRQRSNTRDLIFDVARLIEYASSFYTLYPGDIIMTGTPDGVGPVVAGDAIEMRMDGIGEMTVKVR